MGECLIVRSNGGVDTSNATANKSAIVEGYSCYMNDELVTGSIPKKSIVKNVNSSELVQLENGYYSSDNIVSVTTLKEETIGTGIESDILIGHNGWVNGVEINGSMLDNSGIDNALKVNTSYTIPQGWYSGTEKITQSLTTQAASSVTPSTANKTVCSSDRWTTGNITIIGDSKLVSTNIKNGVNIFGVVGSFSGWSDNPVIIWNNGSVNGGQIWSFTDTGTGGYRHYTGRYRIARYVVWSNKKIPGCNKVEVRATVNPTGTWGDNNKSATVYYHDAYYGGDNSSLGSFVCNTGSHALSFSRATTGYSLGTLNSGCWGVFGETIGYGSCTWGITINWCAVYWS